MYKAKDKDGYWWLHYEEPAYSDGYWLSAGRKSFLKIDEDKSGSESSLSQS